MSTKENSSTMLCATQVVAAVANLAAAGLEFTLPNRGNRQPFTKGWQLFRPDLTTVALHLGKGHNLGVQVKGYADGRILAYFDADYGPGMPSLLQVAPELKQSLASWRASGSGKVFFWAQPEGLKGQATPNLAGEHSKLEFKISGQAAIWGVHPSGQRYETNWAAPITLTAERIRAIWEAWTGQPWNEPKRYIPAEHTQRTATTTEGNNDIQKVKNAWTPTEVFAHHWAGCQIVQDRGEKRILGRGGLICNDDTGLWYAFADETGGDVFNAWAHATNKDCVRDFPVILREMAAAAGIELSPPPALRDGDADAAASFDATLAAADTPTREQMFAVSIDRLRLRLRAADFAQLVPVEMQSATGYRTGDRDRVVADAALGYLWELQRPMARISGLELSTRTGYSPNTCLAAMRRLCRLFVPQDDTGDGGKAAVTYAIAPDALLCDAGSTVLDVSQSRASVLPLATHRATDVFVRSLSAITPDELSEMDERRRLAGVAPMLRNRQLDRRLAAAVDALGPGVLHLVDALQQYGELSVDALAAILHKSPTAARRLVTKAIRAGLVEDGEGVFALVEGWQGITAALSATCPTAGTVHRRRLAAADSRLQYCDAALGTVQTPTRAKELTWRRQRAEKEKWELIGQDIAALNERQRAAGVPETTAQMALRPGRGETFADWQRRRVMDAHADEQALRAFAPTLAGLDRQTAEVTAFYAGYTAYEFAQAWALRAVA